jgi:glycerol-3-phosphate dehydrogenase
LIIGTTDTDYRGSIEEVRPLPEDIDYLLRAVNDFFPSTALTEVDILSTWAGLRPLIIQAARRVVSPAQTRAAGEVLPGNGAPSELTRSHEILNPEPGWWDLAGGKLTTYRLMAEESVDQVVRWLKSSDGQRQDFSPCHTADEPLLPATETAGVSGILPPSLDRTIVEHFCGREWAVHLDDVMVRRSGWHYYLPDARNRAKQVADWMADTLGWTSETRAAELAAYERLSGKSKV